MNENSVIAIIDAIAAKFGIAVDWTAQNVLPYLEELMHRIVSFEIGVYTFWMIFCPIVAIGFGILGYNLIKTAKKINKYDWSDEPVGILGMICIILAGCATVATLVLIPIGTLRIIECVNIPEKIFFDYVTAIAG